jgi:DNA polymerase II small subunit/DNA polymerase delta subunit B
MPYILTKKEIEFIKDWLNVQRGEMSLEEFFKKWSSKRDNSSILEDAKAVEEGRMSLEEFRRKWTKKGDWKNYVRVMRHRLEKKRKNIRRIIKEINEEIKLLQEFFNCEQLP